jgi:hypothetical protein
MLVSGTDTFGGWYNTVGATVGFGVDGVVPVVVGDGEGEPDCEPAGVMAGLGVPLGLLGGEPEGVGARVGLGVGVPLGVVPLGVGLVDGVVPPDGVEL